MHFVLAMAFPVLVGCITEVSGCVYDLRISFDKQNFNNFSLRTLSLLNISRIHSIVFKFCLVKNCVIACSHHLYLMKPMMVTREGTLPLTRLSQD